MAAIGTENGHGTRPSGRELQYLTRPFPAGIHNACHTSRVMYASPSLRNSASHSAPATASFSGHGIVAAKGHNGSDNAKRLSRDSASGTTAARTARRRRRGQGHRLRGDCTPDASVVLQAASEDRGRGERSE